MTLRERVGVPVQRVVDAGSRTYGRLTVHQRILPDVLVCGGPSPAAVLLQRLMASHPAILKPLRNSATGYFDDGYHRGVTWYRTHFATRSEVARVTRQTGLTARAFETSPDYLYHPLAAERFARDLPGVQLVVLVEDPVERAVAQHRQEVAAGFEKLTGLDAAVAAEPDRLAGEAERMRRDPHYDSFSYRHHAYRLRGQYADHLERVNRLVPRDRILVLDAGDLMADPQAGRDRLLRFLRLPHRGRARRRRPRTDIASSCPATLRADLRNWFTEYDLRLGDWLGDTPSWRR